MELKLLHHYTTLTAKTLAATNNTLTESAWQIHVPNLAFTNPCLMDAMLAVSALHMRITTPGDTSLVRMFHGYMASALSQYTKTLKEGVNDTNAEALFTTSALIAFQASASRRFANERQFGENEPYTLPIQWFHSFQGVKTMVLTSWRWLRSSPHVRPIIAAQPALSKDIFIKTPEPFSHLLDDLPAQLATLSNAEAAEIRQSYEHAIAYLNWAHSKPERARILGFPATVSRRFIKLMEEKDPRALSIIASFFAMTRAIDDAWWLSGVASKEVAGIMSLLDPSWWPKLDWAVSVANHEGPLTDEVWGAVLGSGKDRNVWNADFSMSPMPGGAEGAAMAALAVANGMMGTGAGGMSGMAGITGADSSALMALAAANGIDVAGADRGALMAMAAANGIDVASMGMGSPAGSSSSSAAVGGLGNGSVVMGGHIDLLGQIGDAQQIMEVACGRVGGGGMVVSTTLKMDAEVSMVDLLD